MAQEIFDHKKFLFSFMTKAKDSVVSSTLTCPSQPKRTSIYHADLSDEIRITHSINNQLKRKIKKIYLLFNSFFEQMTTK